MPETSQVSKTCEVLPTVFNRKDWNLQNYYIKSLSIDKLFLSKEEIQLFSNSPTYRALKVRVYLTGFQNL